LLSVLFSAKKDTNNPLAPGDALDEGNVLPGLRLTLRQLFDKAGEPG